MRMNNQKKTFIIIVLFILILLSGVSFANNSSEIKFEVKEYTEEYKKWLELPDEEKSKVLMPRMYEIPKTTYISTNYCRVYR